MDTREGTEKAVFEIPGAAWKAYEDKKTAQQALDNLLLRNCTRLLAGTAGSYILCCTVNCSDEM